MRNEHAYYCYGIKEFKECDNPNLIKMIYNQSKQYVFHKNKCYDFVKAICGDAYLADVDMTKSKFDEHIKQYGLVDVMNANLAGRGFVMVTDYADYVEYYNLGQNNVVGITGMSLGGSLYAQDEDELFTDRVTVDEQYHYKPENDDDIPPIE